MSRTRENINRESRKPVNAAEFHEKIIVFRWDDEKMVFKNLFTFQKKEQIAVL